MTTITRSTDAATITPDLVEIFEDDVAPGTVVHDAVGREFPDYTLRPAKSPTGTLKFFFMSHDAAQTARRFHMAAATFSLSAPTMPWLPARYVPQRSIRRVQRDENRQRWTLEVGYREIAP